MKKLLFSCVILICAFAGVNNIKAAAAGRAVGRDINDLMKWKVSRGFGTKMPELASDGTLDLSNKGLVSLNGIEKIQPKERWKVRKLVLDRNNLYELHPATINLFPNLEGIYLGDNRINRIYPGTFTGLDRVRTLDLHGNMIENLDSTVFSGLRGLYHLNLGRNPLRGFDENSFAELVDLRTLNLDETLLDEFSISNFASDNPRLQHIYLHNVPLSENMRKKIARTRPGFFVTGEQQMHPLEDYYSDADDNDDDESLSESSKGTTRKNNDEISDEEIIQATDAQLNKLPNYIAMKMTDASRANYMRTQTIEQMLELKRTGKLTRADLYPTGDLPKPTASPSQAASSSTWTPFGRPTSAVNPATGEPWRAGDPIL